VENGTQYEAVFTNPAGTITTTAAILTVTKAPNVTTNPTSMTTSAGKTASFTAAGFGLPTPTMQWEVSSASGKPFVPIPGATSATYTFSTTATETGSDYEAVFTNSTGAAATAPATLTVTSPPEAATSSNWSGYAAIGSNFTGVTGHWVVPSVQCGGKQLTFSSDWIGIDGAQDTTVEQDGTEADCLDGAPFYDAWYELYGDSAANSGYEIELGKSYPVTPGDEITASVTETSSVWKFNLSDVSIHHDSWTFASNGIKFSGAERNSAEWIVERPEVCTTSCGISALADFGTTSIRSATATSARLVSGPIDAFESVAIAMTNSAQTYFLALPSALGSDAESFTDSWEGAD
jgi:hypothetical protein